MKTRWYITILFVALIGSWGSLSAAAGDPPATTDGTTDVLSDTTEPASPIDKLLADTSQPATAFVSVFADSSEGETDPPKAAETSDASSDNGEDTPAGDLYEDWDTTLVHAEKFDALTFDDTVRIPLNDPGHCSYVHPFKGNITSSFGFRKYRYHFGVDIKLETGDSVQCAFDGKVRIAHRSKSYGYVVVVRHNNGLETYYAHLSKLCVRPGDDVEAGAVLGLGGNTGHSYGSHLHFEVRFRGQPINPNYLIDFKSQCLRTDTYCLTKSDFKYLAESYKVRHYSRKKKKTWYTYYTPGGAHYATPEARRIMAQVPDPTMPGTAPSARPVMTAETAPKSTSAPGTPVPSPQKKPAPPTARTAPPQKTASAPKTVTKDSSKKPAAGAPAYHTVKKGDTLSAVALRYGTTVDKLCKLNGIQKTATLRIGQKLRVK